MKEIKAIIRPFKLLEVIERLQEIKGLPGVTVSEIKGFGQNRATNAEGKMVYEMVELFPRTKLEMVVRDEMVEEIINVIQRYSHTGNLGDGKIFVSDVTDVVKISTNERGEAAI